MTFKKLGLFSLLTVSFVCVGSETETRRETLKEEIVRRTNDKEALEVWFKQYRKADNNTRAVSAGTFLGSLLVAKSDCMRAFEKGKMNEANDGFIDANDCEKVFTDYIYALKIGRDQSPAK